MRNHHERHAIVLRHGSEKRFEGLDTPRRSANADDPTIRSHQLCTRAYLDSWSQMPFGILLQERASESACIIDHQKPSVGRTASNEIRSRDRARVVSVDRACDLPQTVEHMSLAR
jgi:hypothetical protein